MNDGFDIGQSFENILRQIVEFLPELVGALLILLIGYFVALALQSIVRKGLRKLRFDRSVTYSPAGRYVAQVIESPSRFVSKVVFWLVFLGAISMAIAALNIPLLTGLVAGIYAYLPNVIAAIVIFLVASAISAGSAAFVLRVLGKGSPLAKIVSVAIPAITMSIAIFMILSELGIASDIVNITYAAIMGALALGLALAFGLGGRDVAARMLSEAYDKAREQAPAVKAETRRGAANARSEARRADEKMS